jgi:hypothetical protein
MIILDIDEEGFLIAPKFENGPTPRTWRRCLEDLGELKPTSDKQEMDQIIDLYDLESEKDLEEEVPFEKICELIAWETPAGAVHWLLSSFQGDVRCSGILEYYEYPSIGSEFLGIKLIGTRLEFRNLLLKLEISNDAHLPLECEIYSERVSTAAAETALRAIEPNENDDMIDFIEAVPLIEEFIYSKEPALNKYTSMRYGSALMEIPKESELYLSISREINKLAKKRAEKHE